jgi:THO complex subunit 2
MTIWRVVVQALKYVTDMSFDVFVYIMVDALANSHKEQVKDNMNTSDWLHGMFRSYIGFPLGL